MLDNGIKDIKTIAKELKVNKNSSDLLIIHLENNQGNLIQKCYVFLHHLSCSLYFTWKDNYSHNSNNLFP